MDILRRFKKQPSFKFQNRAAADLNRVVPERRDRLVETDVGLYDMVPERAKVQPVSDASLFRIIPGRHRKEAK